MCSEFIASHLSGQPSKLPWPCHLERKLSYLESKFPSIRIEYFNPQANATAIEKELDFTKEERRRSAETR